MIGYSGVFVPARRCMHVTIGYAIEKLLTVQGLSRILLISILYNKVKHLRFLKLKMKIVRRGLNCNRTIQFKS